MSVKFFGWDRLTPPVVVEVEASAKALEPLTKELVEQLAVLQYNPAFIWLLNRCKFQRSILRAELEGKRQASQVDSEFLKSGIAWSGWLEDQLRQATQFGRRQSAPKEALDEEFEAFKEVQRQLEVIG